MVKSAKKFACAVVESGRGHSVAGFDNIALGMLTVFQCTTLAGWAQVMYRTMNSGTYLHFPNPGRLFGPITLTECSYMLRKTDTFFYLSQPRTATTTATCLVFFGSYFVVNLFLAVRPCAFPKSATHCLPILVPEGTSYLCPDCLSIHRDIQD